ncbi:MAG: 4Fe-4S dicluster domain-containing protein [Desulfobacterales bacterium]
MIEYAALIREKAGKLLRDGTVDVFIGYKKGTVPMKNEPVLVSEADKAGVLYWDSHCGLNLCNYLTKRKDRIGIIANGCNSRSIVTHITENQIRRDQLHIVGIPCTGIIDHTKVMQAVDQKEILDVWESNDKLTVAGNGFEETFKKKDFLRNNCALCRHRNPVIFDEMISETVKEQKGIEAYADVKKIEEMAPDKKWEFFNSVIKNCIRCYACRNACPLCYCPTCFVDESQPQWVGKSLDPVDTMTFHILRAYHCAGRCTDCGACETVCPMGIPIRQFTKKLNKDTEDYFSWEAGLDPNQRPPLDIYRPNDYNSFIK